MKLPHVGEKEHGLLAKQSASLDDREKVVAAIAALDISGSDGTKIKLEAVDGRHHADQPALPMNAAMAAFQKRRLKGSTSSIGSQDGRNSNGFGSNLSLDDFYGPKSLEKTSSRASLRKSGYNHPSPKTISRKTSQFEQLLADLNTSRAPTTTIEPLPIEKQGDNLEIRKRKESLIHHRMKKFNSTSTLFIDSTIVNSDIEEFLKYYTYYLQAAIRKSHESNKVMYTVDILSEKSHPLSKHVQFYKKPISRKDIYRFLECMFQSADLGVENVYVNRMLERTKIALQSINWARIVLGGIMLASKVWDDHAIWNIDFCQIFPEVPVTDLYATACANRRNELEAYFLSAVDYNVNVSPGWYTKAYFQLRETVPYATLPWALYPLTFSHVDKIMVQFYRSNP
ncbi:hypothetical protein HDV03_000816 [Kappamyces sp. JEL0829]|nr:hypothetical protein HDV03_000816 [Kappamyces sp. JEL0829]